jgi:hypothetical protein
MNKIDRDKAKIILKESIRKLFEDEILAEDGEFCIGTETVNLMAEAALNVLLAVEEVQEYLEDLDGN